MPPGSWSGPTGHPHSGTSGARRQSPTSPPSPPTARRSWRRPRWRQGWSEPPRRPWPRWAATPPAGPAAPAARGIRAADPTRGRRPGLGPRGPEEGLRRQIRGRGSSWRSCGGCRSSRSAWWSSSLVAYAIISSVADVGLANLVDEFAAADLTWLAVALALSPVIPVKAAVATLGASFRRSGSGPSSCSSTPSSSSRWPCRARPPG